MIVVKVTYTVDIGFVEQNKKNVQRFMDDFRGLNRDDFRYTAYQCSDRQTFVHLSHYQNKEIQEILLNVPSFLEFQKQRDESGLKNKPEISTMDIVATSKDIFFL